MIIKSSPINFECDNYNKKILKLKAYKLTLMAPYIPKNFSSFPPK